MTCFPGQIKIIILDDTKTSYLSYSKMIEDDGSQYPDQIPDFNFYEDIAALPYSSGTTGLSKGVMLTHGNLVANIIQMYYCKELEFLPPTTGIEGNLLFFFFFKRCPGRGANLGSFFVIFVYFLSQAAP